MNSMSLCTRYGWKEINIGPVWSIYIEFNLIDRQKKQPACSFYTHLVRWSCSIARRIDRPFNRSPRASTWKKRREKGYCTVFAIRCRESGNEEEVKLYSKFPMIPVPFCFVNFSPSIETIQIFDNNSHDRVKESLSNEWYF